MLGALEWIFDKTSPFFLQATKLLLLLFFLVFLDNYFDFSRSIFFSHKYDELEKIQTLLKDSSLDKKEVIVLKQSRANLFNSKSISERAYNFFFGFNDTHPLQSRLKYRIKNFSYFWYFLSFLPPFILLAIWSWQTTKTDPYLGPKNKKERMRAYPSMFIFSGFMFAFLFLKARNPSENFTIYHKWVAEIYYGMWGILFSLFLITVVREK